MIRRPGQRLVAHRGEHRRLGAGRDPGPFLVVLRGGGPAVVVGHDRVPGAADRRHPGAPRIPPAGPPGEREPVPRPGHAVRARGVFGDHLVRLGRVVQRMTGDPHVPLTVAADDHRVLDALLRVAGQHQLAAAGVELGRMGGLDHVDPPVLGARRRAAEIEPPGSLGRLHQERALQRIGGHVLLVDHRHRPEVLTVGRTCHRHRVPPAVPQRPPEPVGQEYLPVGEHRGRPARPVPRPRAGRLHRDHAGARPWHGKGADPGRRGAGRPSPFPGRLSRVHLKAHQHDRQFASRALLACRCRALRRREPGATARQP